MPFLPGPAIAYFGRFPTDIIMQTNSSFNGTAQLAPPVLSPGQYTFPVQAGGGLYNFHTAPIEVKQIAYSGTGTLTVTKVLTTKSFSTAQGTTYPYVGPAVEGQAVVTPTTTVLSSTVVATLSSSTPVFTGCILLSPNEYLSMSSTGGSGSPTVAVTAHLAEYRSDGGA